MLSFFDSLTVPGLEKVTIYRDDEDALRFYAMPSTPRIARDDDGDLLLQLLIYARDVANLPPDQLEAQRGWIAASVELRLTAEEEQRVRDHLTDLVNRPEHGFWLRFFRLGFAPGQVKLTLPAEWLSGDVRLTIPTPGGETHVATSKPSLISTNVATLAGDLSQDASELLRQAVLKGGLPMAVAYDDLTFAARIPSIKVRIHGDRSAFLSEQIKRYQITHSQLQRTEIDYWFIHEVREYWTSWTENHTDFNQFRTETQSITMEIDDSDFRTEPEYVAIRAKFEEMALKIFTDSVVPSILRDVSGQFDAARKAAGLPEGQTPPPTSIQSLTSTLTGTVDINLSKSAVVQVKKNPNGALAHDLTPEQITAAVQYLDLSDPYFRELQLNVRANVNFVSDPVFGLKVNVGYEQTDDQQQRVIKGGKSMLFTSADQTQRFRQILARGADGATKDQFAYFSEIIYRDTGETIRVPASGTLTGQGTELVISYRSLGFVKVVATLAPQPPEVSGAQVRLSYPRASARNGEQTFELTATAPTATYFTYVGHDGEPDPVNFTITYHLADGQQLSLPPASTRAQTLTVPSPFEGRLPTTFVAQGDFNVLDRVIVDATYADPGNDLTLHYHAELAANGATAQWSAPTRNPDLTAFTFTTIVTFKNGSSERRGPDPGVLGQTVMVGSGATAALEVLIVPNLDAGQQAVVELSYAHGDVRSDQNFVVQASSPPVTFRVLLRDPGARDYRYRIRVLANATAPGWDSGWLPGSDGVLLVRRGEAPAPPAGGPVPGAPTQPTPSPAPPSPTVPGGPVAPTPQG